jgi:DNA primase
MSSLAPVPPDHAREREEGRQRTLEALHARVHDAATALRTPGDWARCLRLAARMPGEPFANILLIAAQRPGATEVRDSRHWRAAGRQVRRNEKGIEIFHVPAVPSRARRRDHQDDEPERTWRDADRVTCVWDLSQTTGRPVPGPRALVAGEAPGLLWDALRWLARREGFAVERDQGAPADGTTVWAARRIRVLPDLSAGQAVWALAHQLGHVLLHDVVGYPPATTTSGCRGVRKAEADSVAFTVCSRYGITAGNELAYPASWAGTDPRAQPAATILAVGQRITTAAGQIIRHTARILGEADPGPPASVQQQAATLGGRPSDSLRDRPLPAVPQPSTTGVSTEPASSIRRALADAGQFYTGQLSGSWASGYLRARGIGDAAARDWHIGYAPAAWTALTGHLRRLGHDDDTIQAAGLAKPSARGTLIDQFRDRVMLPVHDEHGRLAGFTGRARPDAGPDVPKYLNSPETAVYKKSTLLFGLHQARPSLARGAVPVIAEGPFDAIAVSIAGPGRYAGLAPCGTALTVRQAELLGQATALWRTGILVAFDADTAGRKAAVRAHDILRRFTGRLQLVQLDGKDPAAILQHQGPEALRVTLREHLQPLSALVIDASLEPWERRLDEIAGPLLAMREAASTIASLLPPCTAEQIRDITGGRELRTTDDLLRPVENPGLGQIARVLPAETTYLMVRVAGKLGFDCVDVMAEVANAVNRETRSPKAASRARRDDPDARPSPCDAPASGLASSSFPRPPLTPHAGTRSPASPLSARASHATPAPDCRRHLP